MPRVLLLFPTTTYRAAAFLGAARGLGAEVVVAWSKQVGPTVPRYVGEAAHFK